LKYHRMSSRSTAVGLLIMTMDDRNECDPWHRGAIWRWVRSHCGGLTLQLRVGRPRLYRWVAWHRLRRRLTSCPIFDLSCIHTYLPKQSLIDIALALI
jgi:hypothetical protein